MDLNSLHALSRTCRQFRANLIPFRQQLVKQTLRCMNEQIESVADLLNRDVSSVHDNVRSMSNGISSHDGGRMTSRKFGTCARDMVGECQRCSRVVCRVDMNHFHSIPFFFFFFFFFGCPSPTMAKYQPTRFFIHNGLWALSPFRIALYPSLFFFFFFFFFFSYK